MASRTEEFEAKLTLTSVVLIGVAYMAPAIVVATFGVIAETSGGATPLSYVVTTVAMLLTALSYSKMARLFPESGSVYTYARQILGSHVGFLAGWAILLDYFFLPAVAWLIQATYLNAQFPSIPVGLWLVVTIVLTTTVNILGIVLTDRVNKALMALAFVTLAILAGVCLHYVAGHPSPLAGAFWNSGTSVSSVVAAAAIAAYSFLGFDAVTTLSEETIRPQRTIARAVVLIVLIGGLIFVAMALVLQWAHPGGQFSNADSAGYEVATTVGGSGFAGVVNIATIASFFASGLAVQASTSRLLYVMGRDSVLPKGFFGRLHPKLRTPLPGLLLIAVVGLLGLAVDMDMAMSFINFGAFLGFTLVNIAVIGYFLRHRNDAQRPSPFGHIVLPALGAVVSVFLITQLGATAVVLGLSWLVLGVVYLAVLTLGFKEPVPELAMNEPTQGEMSS